MNGSCCDESEIHDRPSMARTIVTKNDHHGGKTAQGLRVPNWTCGRAHSRASAPYTGAPYSYEFGAINPYLRLGLVMDTKKELLYS